MVCAMKTTLNLDDELLARAKRTAAERGTTLTSVVEEGLRSVLHAGPRPPFRLHLVTVRGDRPPRVDPADREALFHLLDQADGE